jgi:hypothetical protein
MTFAPPYVVPSLAELLAQADASAHPLIVTIYDRMLADKRLGMPRSDSIKIGGWKDRYQRNLENSGALPTWVDGPYVRIWPPAVYLKVVANIIATYPAGGDGVRKAVRMPPHTFPKGYHRSRQQTRRETVENTS